MTGSRILTLDLETFPNLAYTFSTRKAFISPSQIVTPVSMACFAAKWHDERRTQFSSTFHDGATEMLSSIHALLDEADIVVTYNGKKFDIPHINRELLLGGYQAPSPYKQVDLFQVATKTFRFATFNLDEVARELGLGHKLEHEGFPLWLKCMAGDEKAWARFKKYNIQDVVLTEKAYDRMLGWITNHPHVGLYTGESMSCSRCGSTKLQKRGTAVTALSVFQRYQCLSCGGWSRGGKRQDGVDARAAL